MYRWIEPELLPLFGQLLIRALPYLPVFGLTCLCSVCLVLRETRISAQGGVRGLGVCVPRRGGSRTHCVRKAGLPVPSVLPA